MKRIYFFRASDNAITGFMETSDSYTLGTNEVQVNDGPKDLFTATRVPKKKWNAVTSSIIARTQTEIDADELQRKKDNTADKLQLKSPNGSIWDVKVDDAGNLTGAKA